MKRTTIIIDGKPFTYDDESEDISYATNKPITEEDAKSLLQTTKKLFDECGMKFYLCFGTLLGAIRDNGLIKGDEDVDVFVESEEILRKNLPYLQENGLKLCRINNHHFYSFHTENKSYIDVYIKRDLPNSIWKLWCCSINNGAYPKRFFKKYEAIQFLGVDCLCPSRPERFLEYLYGKTWRIPQKGHNYIYDSPSRYFWRKKIKPRIETIIYIIKLAITHPIMFLKKFSKKYFNS